MILLYSSTSRILQSLKQLLQGGLVIAKMASTASEIIRFVDHIVINIHHQPDARYPNGQVRADLERSAPWYLVHSPLMQMKTGILQVHCQGSSPFHTHPANMWTFLFAMFIHYGAALYYITSQLTGSRCSEICDVVGYVSGSLASAAFMSILVPRSLVPFVFVVWGLHLPIYIDAARNWILNLPKKLYGGLFNGAVYVQNIWNDNSGSNNQGATNPPN